MRIALNLSQSISIHASRGGSDHPFVGNPGTNGDFNPRFPRGKRQGGLHAYGGYCAISIHASRGGSDCADDHTGDEASNISIHASRGGSDRLFSGLFEAGEISIHASRGGSDGRVQCGVVIIVPISIHASRGGKRPEKSFPEDAPQYFNPRFPRGKRLQGLLVRVVYVYFNPRFPRGKRPVRLYVRR